MKKTWLIIAVIVIAAVVAWLLFRKKDENAEQGSGGMIGTGVPNPLAGQSADPNGYISGTGVLSAGDILGNSADVTEQVSYLLGLTQGEIADYKKQVERYKLATGLDLSGVSYSVVLDKISELEKMQDLQRKIYNEFGVSVDLKKQDSNELTELQEIYNENKKTKEKITSEQKKATENLGAKFINQFNLDQAFNLKEHTKRKSLFDSTQVHDWWELTGYKPWNDAVMGALANLSDAQKEIADTYVRNHWNGRYTVEPKKQKWGKSLSDAESRDFTGKSICEALLVSDFMKNGRGASAANMVISAYTNI